MVNCRVKYNSPPEVVSYFQFGYQSLKNCNVPSKVAKNFNSGTPSGLIVKLDGILTLQNDVVLVMAKRRCFALLGDELIFFETLWDKLQIFKNNCLQFYFLFYFIFLKKKP